MLRDLEKTVVRSADYLIRHWEQGRAYVFGDDDPFSIGDDKFEMDRLMKEDLDDTKQGQRTI